MKNKILVFRNKEKQTIECICDSSRYKGLNLQELIDEFNATDKVHEVSAEIIPTGSLTEYLLSVYDAKRTTRDDIDECINSIWFGLKRLDMSLDSIKRQIQELKQQNHPQI